MAVTDLITGGFSRLPYPFIYLITLGVAYVDAFELGSTTLGDGSEVLAGSGLLDWVGGIFSGVVNSFSGHGVISYLLNVIFSPFGLVLPKESFFFLMLLAGVFMLVRAVGSASR